MKTTAIMIEYLISGIMFLFVLLICSYCFFPDTVTHLFSKFYTLPQLFTNNYILIPTLVSLAYGFGILTELIALNMIEWKHKRIKSERLKNFLEENRGTLKKGPIDLEKVYREKKSSGILRFFVLMKNSTLYNEIESQHHRLRIIRVLFLIENVLILSVLRQIIRHPTIPLISFEIFLILITVFSYYGIGYRMNRYNECIERSYLVTICDRTNRSYAPEYTENTSRSAECSEPRE